MEKGLNISVIIPVFNEERSIKQVLEAVNSKVAGLYEIVAVDDGSTDSTAAICLEFQRLNPRMKYIPLEGNRGKSQALKEGIMRSSGDIVIVQDADLEYDPAEINAVVAPIQEGVADLVLGSRFQVRKASRALYFRHYMANKFITFLSNLFTDLNLTDVESCYKAFRGDLLRRMTITSHRFGFEIESVAKMAKLKKRIYEVPISYYGRSYEEGKKIGLMDGLMAIFYIFKFNLFTSKKNSFRDLTDPGE